MGLNEPKAKMDLNEPKWAQNSVNIFKTIRYEPKIGLNELKWAFMSSNVNKFFTSDAYPV